MRRCLPSGAWTSAYGFLFVAMCGAAVANARAREFATLFALTTLTHESRLYERYLQEPARSNNHNIDVGVQGIVLRLQLKGEASHHKPDVSIYVSYHGCG